MHTPPLDFFEDVKKGLLADQKYIPFAYLYNEKGFEILNQIQQETLYLVKSIEVEVLKENIDEIIQFLPENPILAEFGCGMCSQIRIFFDNMKHIRAFIPIDQSQEILDRASKELKGLYPHLDIYPMTADFLNLQELPKMENPQKVGLFLGGTITNFSPSETQQILKSSFSLCSPTGDLIVTIDFLKDESTHVEAYSDEKKLHKAFSQNLVKRLNEELDASLDLDDFDHFCRFNKEKSCVQTYLRCTRNIETSIRNVPFSFKEGECILTEEAFKYTIETFTTVVDKAGLEIKRLWPDQNESVGIFYLARKNS